MSVRRVRRRRAARHGDDQGLSGSIFIVRPEKPPCHTAAPEVLLVQHLVSQIAVVSRWMASLHSLTTRVGRQTVQFPPADHSGRSRLALMLYLIFVCCPGIKQDGRRRRLIGRLFLSVRNSAPTVFWFAARSPPSFADEDEAAGSMGSAAVATRVCVTTIFSAVNDPIRMPTPKQASISISVVRRTVGIQGSIRMLSVCM